MMPRSPRRGRKRLSRSAEFERVYRQGKSVANRDLVLYSFPNDSTEGPRLGLSVSRKVGGAIERNRVKRLLREAFQGVAGDVRGGHDVVVVARPQVLQLAERDGLDGVSASLGELLSKAALMQDDAAQRDAAQGDAQVETESVLEETNEDSDVNAA